MKSQLFEKFGLNKTEALVYKDLIENGQSTPPVISQRTGVSRENVYFVLKSLAEKELILRKDTKKKQTFQAESPKRLKSLIEKERSTLTEREKFLEEAIPELMDLYNLGTGTPAVSFFKGKEGIKNMYDDLFRGEKPEEVVFFRSIYDEEFFGDYVIEDILKTVNEGIKQRFLSSNKLPLPKELEKNQLIQEKVVSKDKLENKAEIAIYSNKVMLASFKKDKMGVIVESKEIADTMRMIFNYIWEKE